MPTPPPLTIVNFHVTEADGSVVNAADAAAFNSMLTYNSASPTALAGWTAAESNGATPKNFVIVHDGQDITSPDFSTVSWDPNSALAVYNSAGQIVGVQSAALGADHELLGHAETQSSSDVVAIGKENVVANEIAEPTRTTDQNNPYFHNGVTVYEDNPTESTGSNGVWKETGGTLPTGTSFTAGKLNEIAPSSNIALRAPPSEINSLAIGGTGNTFTVVAGAIVTVTGSGNSVIGNNLVVTAAGIGGTAVNLTATGTGDVFLAQNGSSVTLGAGSSNDSVTMSNGSTLSSTASLTGITANCAGSSATLNGIETTQCSINASGVGTLSVSGGSSGAIASNSNVIFSGSGDNFILGSGVHATLASGDIVTTSTNDSLLCGATPLTTGATATTQTLQCTITNGVGAFTPPPTNSVSNQTITVAPNSAINVTGTNDVINASTGDAVVLSSYANTVNASAGDIVVTATRQATDTINGSGYILDGGAAKQVLYLNGSAGSTVTVDASGDIWGAAHGGANSGQINVANGVSDYLNGSNDTLSQGTGSSLFFNGTSTTAFIGSDSIGLIGSGTTLLVSGSGDAVSGQAGTTANLLSTYQQDLFGPNASIYSQTDTLSSLAGSVYTPNAVTLGTDLKNTIDWTSGGSQEQIFSGLKTGVKEEILNYTGVNDTGEKTLSIDDMTNGDVIDTTFSYSAAGALTGGVEDRYSSSGALLGYADLNASGGYVSGNTGGYLGGYGDIFGGTYGYGYEFTSKADLAGTNIGSIAQYDSQHGSQSSSNAAILSREQSAIVSGANGADATQFVTAQFEGAKWAHKVITWSAATSPGTAASPFSGYIGAQYETAMERAFQTWAQSTGLVFQQVKDSGHSDIRIGFGNFDTANSGVAGLTSYFADNGTFSSGTIIRLEDPSQSPLVKDGKGNIVYQSTGVNFQQLLEHEIGHALGLANNSDVNSIMYYQAASNNGALDVTDISGIQQLYGTNNHVIDTLSGANAIDSSAQLIQAMSTFGIAQGSVTQSLPINDNQPVSVVVPQLLSQGH